MTDMTDAASGGRPTEEATAVDHRPEIRLDVLFVSSDHDQVAELLSALGSTHVDIHQTSGAPVEDCPLAVLITPGMLEENEAQLAQHIAGNYREVLPVSFLPGAAPLLDADPTPKAHRALMRPTQPVPSPGAASVGGACTT